MNHLKHRFAAGETHSSNLPPDLTYADFPQQPSISSSATTSNQLQRTFATSVSDPSKWLNFKKKIGLGYRYPAYRMRFSSLKLYICCTEMVEFDLMFDYLELPDTFFSYFLILQIHIWLLLARIAQEGDEGVFVKKNVAQFLWEDLDERSKKMVTDGVLKNRKESLAELSAQFTACLFAYDEGALSDDKALAGALWRTLYQKKCQDPTKLSRMVHYVRKQMAHLDHQKSDTLLQHGIVTFLPFDGDTLKPQLSYKNLQDVLLGFKQKKG